MAATNLRPNPQHSARRALAVATPEKAHYVSAHVMGESELFYAVDTTLFSFDLKTQTHNVENESAWQSQPHTGPIRVLLARQDGEEAEDGVAPTNSDTMSTKEAKKRRVEDAGEAQGEEVKTRIHFATAGDDKMMVFWDEAKKEVARFVHNKKITAAAFVPEDGQKIVFADKFGDVYRLDVGALLHCEEKEATRRGPPARADKNGENALPLGDEGTPTSPAVGTTSKIITTNAAAAAASSSSSAEVGLEKKLAVEPELLFGHLAIVTSMCFVSGKSNGGQDEQGRGSEHRFLVTADNHEKIRVSHWPRFYDIANFCLAHTGHVTRVVPLPRVASLSGGKNEHQALFASLGADGEMFVWDAAGDEEHALQSTYSMGSGYLPTELCFFQKGEDAEGKGDLVALVHANSLSRDEIQSLGGEGDIKSKQSANSASGPRLTFAHGHLLRPDTVCVGHSRGNVYYVDQKNGHVLAAPVGGVGAAAEMAAAKLTVQDLGCPESFAGAAKKERLYKYFKDGEEDN